MLPTKFGIYEPDTENLNNDCVLCDDVLGSRVMSFCALRLANCKSLSGPTSTASSIKLCSLSGRICGATMNVSAGSEARCAAVPSGNTSAALSSLAAAQLSLETRGPKLKIV